MTLDDLPTPCLVLDRGLLKRNLARMAAAVARHPGLVLRPHMKTAKSLAVAGLVRALTRADRAVFRLVMVAALALALQLAVTGVGI